MMNYLTDYINQDGVPVNRSTGLISPGYLDKLEEKLNPKNSRSNIGAKLVVGGLILLTTAGAIAITLGLGGCNQGDYNHSNTIGDRIKNTGCSVFSEEDKINMVEEYKSIDLNNLTESQKRFLNLSYDNRMKTISKSPSFQSLFSECGIFNYDNEKLSNRDFLLLHNYIGDK